jgi:hypothetical protein
MSQNVFKKLSRNSSGTDKEMKSSASLFWYLLRGSNLAALEWTYMFTELPPHQSFIVFTLELLIWSTLFFK